MLSKEGGRGSTFSLFHLQPGHISATQRSVRVCVCVGEVMCVHDCVWWSCAVDVWRFSERVHAWLILTSPVHIHILHTLGNLNIDSVCS